MVLVTSIAQRTKLIVGAHARRYPGSVGRRTIKPPNAMKKNRNTGNRATAVSWSRVAAASICSSKTPEHIQGEREGGLEVARAIRGTTNYSHFDYAPSVTESAYFKASKRSP